MRRSFILLFITFTLSWSGFSQPITREMYIKVVHSNSSFNCPLDEFWCTVEKLTFQGDYLHFHIKMKHDILMGLTQSEIREFCADRIRYNQITAEFTYLYGKMPEVNAGFIYDFQLLNSQDAVDSTFSIRFTPTEVRQLLADQKKPQYENGDRWESRKEIEYLVNVTNRKCRTSNEIGVDSVSFVQDTLFLHYNIQSLLGFQNLDDIRKKHQIIYKELKKIVMLEAGLGLWVDAEINVTYRFHDLNSSQFEDFTFEPNTLEELDEWSEDLEPATTEQIEAYIKEFTKDPTLYAGMSENNISLAEINYQDRILQFVYHIDEKDFNYSVAPEEYQAIKSTLAVSFNYFLQEAFETPEIFEDSYITFEKFYDYLKGFNALFTDPATKKGLEFFISSEELQNAEIAFAKKSTSSYSDQAKKDIIAGQLSQELKSYTAQHCPITNDKFTLEKIAFEDGDIHAYGSLNLKQSPDTTTFKAGLIDNLYSSIYIQKIEAIDARILYHFLDINSNDTLQFIITPEELRAREQFMNDPTKATQILLNIISNAQDEFPIELDDATYLDSMTLTDNELIYHYSLDMDDELFNQAIKENGDILRVNLLTNLEAERPEALLKACVQSNRKITYRYSAKSHRYFWETSFTPLELESILAQ